MVQEVIQEVIQDVACSTHHSARVTGAVGHPEEDHPLAIVRILKGRHPALYHRVVESSGVDIADLQSVMSEGVSSATVIFEIPKVDLAG